MCMMHKVESEVHVRDAQGGVDSRTYNSVPCVTPWSTDERAAARAGDARPHDRSTTGRRSTVCARSITAAAHFTGASPPTAPICREPSSKRAG